MMKRQTVIRAILSMGLVFVLALTGCSDDDSGDGGLSTIGIGPSDTTFTGDVVGNAADALDLFQSALAGSAPNNFAYKLSNVPNSLLNAKITAASNQRDFSVSVPVDDNTLLKGALSVTTATINGSMAMSYKGSVDYANRYSLPKDGSYSTSSSSSLTYKIDTPATVNTNYTVAGTVKVESESSGNMTMKDPDMDDSVGSQKSVLKKALALTIINTSTNKGAKFVISIATSNSGSRNATGNSENNISDLQVYDKDNNLKFTIPGENVTNLVNSFR